MEKTNNKKLIASAALIVASIALLLGLTFAWFTDTVANKGNKIQAGTLKVQLLNGTDDIGVSSTPVFAYDTWEPGYSTAKASLSVKNNGSLAVKYELRLQSGEMSQSKGMENAIDVYVGDQISGTLADYLGGSKTLDSGTLTAGASSTAKEVYLKMKESAGSQYQGAVADFDILLVATQATSEIDGFGNDQYDKDAKYPTVVATPAEFEAAIAEGGIVQLAEDVVLDGSKTIAADTTLDLRGKTLTVGNGADSLKAAVGTTLTIEGSGTIEGVVYADNKFNNGSTIVIDASDNFVVSSSHDWAVYGGSGSNIVINGGTYTATQKGAGVIHCLGSSLTVRDAIITVGSATVMNSSGVRSSAANTYLENVTVNANYSTAVDLTSEYGATVIKGGSFTTDKESSGFSSPTISYQGTLDISDATITRVNTGIEYARSWPTPTEVEGLVYSGLTFVKASNCIGDDIDLRSK
ncbi:hypothetical protein C1879_07795 [Paraeggerthella hongkongensis]|nr:hypothetical protein C1879_07795 [Paraeggerthella hongkongensis]